MTTTLNDGDTHDVLISSLEQQKEFYEKYKDSRDPEEKDIADTAKIAIELLQGQLDDLNVDTIIVQKDFFPRPFTERLLKRKKFVWEGTRGNLWHYDVEAGIWKVDGENFVKHYFRVVSGSVGDNLKKKHIIDEITQDVKECSYKEGGLPEPDVNNIPCANGVYNLSTDEFRKFRAEDHFRFKLRWKYNPLARCKFLKKLIDGMLPEDQVSTLYELIAYCLYRSYPLQKLFILLGIGRNGKTTYANILTRLLGQRNISNITLGDFESNRFAASNLFGKLANISGEIDYSDLEQTRLIKQVTGGDNIQADRKFLNPIYITNYAKLIFLTNALPKTHDTTDAFFRRVCLIQFPYKFKNDASIDIALRSDSPEMHEEFEGLLFLSIQNLKRLMLNNFLFTNNQSIDDIRIIYTHLSNPIVQFLDENVERTHINENYIYKFEFVEKLNEWLKEKGFNNYSSEKVGRAMKELGYEDGKKYAPDGEKQYRAWVGLQWSLRQVRHERQVVYNSFPHTGETVVNNVDYMPYPDNKDIPESNMTLPEKCSQCYQSSDCNDIGKTLAMRELCGGLK